MNPSSPQPMPMARRTFLITSSLAAGGLLVRGAIACADATELASVQATAAGDAAAEAPAVLNAYVTIAPDNTITIVSPQAEMGQGIQTTLPAALAEELEADWTRVRIVQAPTGEAYRNPRLQWQFTGNSESTTAFFDLMREMGATARIALIAAAAQRWQVDPSSCRVERSVVRHDASGRHLTFGALAALAASIASASTPVAPTASAPVPATTSAAATGGATAPERPTLKAPRDWTLLGRSLPRVENRDKVTGAAIFGIDVTRAGLVHAAVKTSPVIGGGVAHFDADAVRHKPGVIDIVSIPNGVAVVADSYWRARQALQALPITFTPGPHVALSSETLRQDYARALDGSSWHLAHADGDTSAALARAAATQSAVYESQFLTHAPMEPMNATAHVTADRCEVWAPTQGQELARIIVSQTLGLPPERVAIHRTLIGGGFGRRLTAEFILQAVLVSKAVGRPVKLIWSREEDMQHGLYRPAVLHRLTAGVDAAGSLQALAHRVVSPSILQFVFAQAVTDTFDPSCVEGLTEMRYRIPHTRVDYHRLKTAVPTSVMRTTGFGPNVFALESFIDELAHRAKVDPYRYRRTLLAHDPRALRVLDLVAEKAGWDRPSTPGRHRGLAFCDAFRTLTAHIVELSMPAPDAVRIHRVVCVVDPGTVLDPAISANSIEGGLAWALSNAFLSDIHFEAGRVVESNYHDYRVLRFPQMPPIEIHFVDSGARPLGGVGEVGPVSALPALTNAIFRASGRRYRSLPLARHGLHLLPDA